MNFTRLLKRTNAAFVERFGGQRVVFHHVPKCGGTSAGRALRTAYLLSQATVTPEESFKAFKLLTERDDRDQMLIDVLPYRDVMFMYLLYSDVRCVSAHVRFRNQAFDAFHDRYRFVTVLREPVDRFISHYFWSHNRPQAHGHIPDDFETFLNSERARRVGATYAEYFSGLANDVPVDSRESIEASIANLNRMDVVGFLDDVPSFEEQLKTRLSRTVRIGHTNKGKSPGKQREILNGPHRDRILELCAPDRAIWDAVQHLRQPQRIESATVKNSKPATVSLD
ncbi:MAG: sulfotransferase family protein [Alphaproteobacteria bacterium]|nr:sulfotransferase family protein [Alphaproteobacteria bacterium]